MRMEETTIEANGTPGKRQGVAPGSGGGSGGPISIVTKNLVGNPKITADGGQGSEGGGGGGSGGRLLIRFLRGYSWSSQPNQSIGWRGDYSLKGGGQGVFN